MQLQKQQRLQKQLATENGIVMIIMMLNKIRLCYDYDYLTLFGVFFIMLCYYVLKMKKVIKTMMEMMKMRTRKKIRRAMSKRRDKKP